MKYKMNRSTEEDRPYRDESDFWMDWAVLDSMPYLHFVQYKVYSLHRAADQQQALDNLIRTIDTEPNLGRRETARTSYDSVCNRRTNMTSTLLHEFIACESKIQCGEMACMHSVIQNSEANVCSKFSTHMYVLLINQLTGTLKPYILLTDKLP
jgi:hypothetical protein